MRPEEKQAPQSNWEKLSLPVLALATLVSGCARIRAAGADAPPVFSELSSLAVWSWGWFVPAIILYALVASDHDETREVSGTAWSSRGTVHFTTHVPTGRIISGDPAAALHGLVFWLSAYPIGYFYFPIFWHAGDISLAGLPNLDWALLEIVFPISGISLIWWLIGIVERSRSFVARIVTVFWKVLIGCGAANLASWLVIIFIRWLAEKQPPTTRR